MIKNKKSRVGFTLMEMLIVMGIFAFLASIAIPNYTRLAEKGRAAEAKRILGQILRAEIGYYQLNLQVTSDLDELGFGGLPTYLPPVASADYYFKYGTYGGALGAYSWRCLAGDGGKSPDWTGTPYFIVLYENGTFNTQPASARWVL